MSYDADEIDSDSISDANLFKITSELQKRMRAMANTGPAKEIRIRNDPNTLKDSKWGCSMAAELSKLSIKLEQEHEESHNHAFCDKATKAIRMTRDRRFTTTYSRYQAIVIQAEFTRSLASLAGDEVEVLNRWAVYDNEKQCRECIDMMSCRAEKCTHGCHQFRKEMTTKGIGWAQRENEELAALTRHLAALNSDTDNLCDFIKVIIYNPHLKMNQADKKNIMAKHINIDKCDSCIYYTSENPKWFSEHLE